ncbi:vesicle coat component [Ascosphaera aggregata]|nr:vesicle coat component [Ascosphaera aggregata]
MGKKSRHSRSASWHPAWRADDDSSDSDRDASVQPLPRPSLESSKSKSSSSSASASASSITRPPVAGQKNSGLLQTVAEESIDDRIAASQHQQAHSEPHPPRPSTVVMKTTPLTATATATAVAACRERDILGYQSAAAAVDTNSISSPVSLSPFASPNSSGFHVQSGALTFDEGPYASNLVYEHYNSHGAENNLNNNDDDNDNDNGNGNDNDDEHDKINNDNDHDYHNNNNKEDDNNNDDDDDDDDDDDENDDYNGEFPDTIVIEDDAPLSPPLGMSHAATERYSYSATSLDTPSSNTKPHAVHHQPRRMTAERARDSTVVMHFSRPFPRRADTARFFERDDILNRTQSFPMQPHSDSPDAADRMGQSNDGQHHSWSRTVAEHSVPEDTNRSDNHEKAMDSNARHKAGLSTIGQSKADGGDGDEATSSFLEQLIAGPKQTESPASTPCEDRSHVDTKLNSNLAMHAPAPPPPEAPQILQHDLTQHSIDATADVSSNRDPRNLVVPDPTEKEEYDSDMDDRLSTQSKPVYEPTENGVRFDEGLPLIGAHKNDRNGRKKSGLTSSALKKHNRTISSIFAMDEPAEEEDFFKEVLTTSNDNGQSTTNSRGSLPPALKRKSTSEVLGSMSFDNDKESPTLKVIEEDLEASQNEEENKAQADVPQVNEAPTEVKEEELAEKWKAMGFDDDDLLGGEDSILETPPDASETPAGPVHRFETPTAPTVVNDYFGPTTDYIPQATAYANTPAATVSHASLSSLTQPPRPALENRYAPHQPSTTDLVSGIAGLTPPEPGASSMLPAYAPQQQQQQQQERKDVKPISFTERKESYRSPYDLPEDLTRQTRRQQHPVAPKIPGPVSYPATQVSAAPLLRKSYSHFDVTRAAFPAPPRPSSQSPPQPPPLPKSQPPSNFYEELPAVAPRSRSRPRIQKAYSSTQQQPVAPPVLKVSQVPAAAPQQPASTMPPAHPGLPTSHPTNPLPSVSQGPVSADPYSLGGPTPQAPAPLMPQAKPSTRYSPKPAGFATGTMPPISNKYSPAPATALPANRYAAPPVPRESSLSPQPRTVLPFQPRTSSPLAANAEPTPDALEVIENAIPPPPPVVPSAMYPLNVSRKSSGIIAGVLTPPPPASVTGTGTSAGHYSPAASPPSSQPRYEPLESHQSKSAEPAVPAVHNPYAPSPVSQVHAPHVGPETVSSPAPSNASRTMGGPAVRYGLPPRSATQSYTSRVPAHVSHGSKRSLPRTTPEPPSIYSSTFSSESQQPRSETSELECIAPTDGRELDPLQRWKGCPVFKYGYNGAIVSVFPKHVPRYASGHMVPRIMPTVGEIRVKRARSFLPECAQTSEFPGPLKGKQKKKDLIAWLSSMISNFESTELAPSLESPQERHERILLWKIVRILVEHDGQMSDNPEFETSIRSLLSSSEEVSEIEELPQSIEPKIVRPEVSADIKALLILGEREKAVWQAVDNNHWGHAMLLSSTFENKTLWRQVVSEFIRKEILPLGASGKSLAAAYEVFAGNVEESVDCLVPPSVRAGLQMVSKDNAAPGGNGFEGLEKWKETLQIILSNRIPDYHLALQSLSRLLACSGRIAAAHICALLAAPAAHSAGQTLDVFGGVRDAHALIVLLGWDHRRHSSSVNGDINAICLTEAYEFAISTLAGQPTRTLPHLQAFKLHHAMCLAERGQTSESQQYCEVLTSMFKSTTNHSPYYNAVLLPKLDDLMKRLVQSSADTGSSWISKPSMNKVSDSVWAKFSSFVAGEDSEASDANGLAGQTPGPFSNVLGTMSTPSLANPSVDGSATYLPRPPSVPVGLSVSRCANSAQSNPYAPQSPPSDRSSLELQRPNNRHVGSTNPRPSPYDQPPAMSSDYHVPSHHKPYGLALNMNTHLQPDSTPNKMHMPLSPVAELMVEAPTKTTAAPPSRLAQSSGSLHAGDVASSVVPSPYGLTSEPSAYHAPEKNQGYVPPSYEPPSYTPPSYESPSDTHGAESQSGSDAEVSKPKKKSFMDLDDDDDLLKAAETVKQEEKARHDREAAERIRKAAEEDAKRDAAQSQKKSWFSGWFGKKNNDEHGTTVVRAKLGEESSFYYDKELKRWVNKKDPNSAKPAASAVPPPPKAPGPPRGSTPIAPTPSGQAASLRSSSASPFSAPPQVPGLTFTPPPAGSGPAAAAAARPPIQSRPSTTSPPQSGSPQPPVMPQSGSTALTPPPKPAALNASSIDDLLGAPAPRTHSGRSKKKGRGYVDIMAK